MSEIRPQYLIRRVSRHGTVAWYVWRRPGPQIRLREPYGSKAFWREYRAALYGEPAPQKCEPAEAGSLTELISDYMASRQWKTLSEATRADRTRVFRKVIEKAGHAPAAAITRAMVVESREAAKSYSVAKALVTSLRGLFKWAMDVERVTVDPTADVGLGPAPQTQGHHTWTAEDMERFEAYWPIGSRQRLWYEILKFTGMRRADVTRLRWSHIEDGVLNFCTGKKKKWVHLPITAEFQIMLDAHQTGHEYLIESAISQPFAPQSFTILFSRAAKQAGVNGSAHGVRKGKATAIAHGGGSVPELNASLGWTGYKMAMLYTDAADRVRLAKAAQDRERAAREHEKAIREAKARNDENNTKLLPPSEGGNKGP